MIPDVLVSQFARARLEVKVTAAPLVRAGNSAIVQLDIARDPQRFLLWKGDDHNQVVVQGTDKKLRQLVLFVREPRREFEVRVRKEQVGNRRLLRKDGNHFVWVREFTDSAQRHLLCGMDEQHYFVAQLPHGVATVQEAHQALYNPAAGKAAQDAGAKVIRQGEWFFVKATHRELDALRAGKFLVRRNVPAIDGTNTWRRGRAHVVEALLQLPPGAAKPLTPGTVYVRGKVRHPDHATLHLLDWHRVFGNHEASQPVGVQWAD